MSLYGEAKAYHEINFLPETYINKNARLNNFMGLSSSKLGQKTLGQHVQLPQAVSHVQTLQIDSREVMEWTRRASRWNE